MKGGKIMEYVAPHETFYCQICGCMIPAYSVTDKNNPICIPCEYRAK